MRRKFTHRLRAQSIIETVVGIIFLIPIVLLLFDVAVLVLANTANDNLAKQAARAAASAQPANGVAANGQATVNYAPNARAAADAVVDRFRKNTNSGSLWMGVGIANFSYNGTSGSDAGLQQPSGTAPNYTLTPVFTLADPGSGNVSVYTGLQVQVPVPFPGIGGPTLFVSRAVEPIVSQPP